MGSIHTIKYIGAVSAASKRGESNVVTVPTDYGGTTAVVAVNPGDIVGEVTNTQNDDSGFPVFQTLSLWEVQEIGTRWVLLPKPKSGDLVFAVGGGAGVSTGASGVVTDDGFVRQDVQLGSLFSVLVTLGDHETRIAALEAP
jgi:hypothetical protein